MNERGFLWSINQFGEFMENLTSDCDMLKELLQSIVIIQERGSTTPFSTTANLFERANGTRIERGTITNVAGSSNSVIVIGPHELGVGVLILLLVACLFLLLSSEHSRGLYRNSQKGKHGTWPPHVFLPYDVGADAGTNGKEVKRSTFWIEGRLGGRYETDWLSERHHH
ncbi:hypothetical protein F5887DRAFT_922816 [Amanita rubescens]|nr:hypothetical protein F5887DRAFT_922819 [Amanita rubescens]KAF8331232.1 hypothetical protein F5887DRAFT_922816 [Amanita rubescens]